MQTDEVERDRPGLGGGEGIVTGLRIAEKRVLSIRELDVEVILACRAQAVADRMHLLGSDMPVAAAPEEEHRAAQFARPTKESGAHRIRRDAATIIGNRA